jgi:hypothetical protein
MVVTTVAAVLALSGSFSFGQASSLTIGSIEACPGKEVLIPVTANNLLNVGAITLYIGFDTIHLQYQGVVNLDPQLAGMSINLMTNPTQIGFAWSSPTAANFPQNKFFDIKFIYVIGNCSVIFNPGCEITDITFNILPVQYINGGVFPEYPQILGQPRDTLVYSGNDAFFTVIAPTAQSYHWEESINNGSTWIFLEDGGKYSGTHTQTLQISDVILFFDQFQYQCLLSKNNCETLSDAATLLVDTMIVSTGSLQNRNIMLRQYPNPLRDHLRIEYYLPSEGEVYLELFQSDGKKVTDLVRQYQLTGTYQTGYDASRLTPGIYTCRLSLLCREGTYTVSHRIMKIVN